MSMITANKKLLPLIQELKQLLSEDDHQPQFMHKAAQNLARMTHDLDSDKLNVCLVSSELELAESFHHRLNSDQTLEGIYHFERHKLTLQPLQVQSSLPVAFLTLRVLTEEGEEIQQLRYELSSQSLLDIGRKPGCDVYVPNQCTRVSGQHLELHACSLEDAYTRPQWRVQNANGCKNGTFIHGEQLTGSHILQPGDRLVLGDEHFTSKSPALLFEYAEPNDIESVTASIDHHTQPLENLINCDRLLLIIDAHRELLAEEKALLEAAKLIAVTEVFLVVAASQAIEVVNLSQEPHSSLSVGSLSQAMASIDHKEKSATKAKRVLNQVLSIIERIRQLLLTEQAKIKQEVQTVEYQHAHVSKQDSVVDITTLMKVINEQKLSFVKAIETSFSDSKHDLLDDSLADSIQQKIQDVIDELDAQIVKQGGKKYLELKAAVSEVNVNDFIVHFCEEELLIWANKEWRKICQGYGNDGLEGLVRSSNSILKSVREKSNVAFELQIKPEIEFEGVFQSSLRRIPCRIEYQEDPIAIYFIKKIRSSAFQVMGILFLLSFVGVSRGKFMKAIVSQITVSPLLSSLALGTIAWLLYKLYETYQNDRITEVRKASEKVRQELRNYYQKLVKNRFAEKLIQTLEMSLKEEISRFDEGIKAFVNTTTRKFTETERGQTDSRAYLKDCQSKLIKLERRLRDFQKVKDKLQRLETG